MTTYLLLKLKTLDDRSQLAQDLVGLLMVFNLSGDKLCEVAEGFRGIKNLVMRMLAMADKNDSFAKATYVLHNTHSLFSLRDEFIFGLLDLLLRLGGELLRVQVLLARRNASHLPGCALDPRLDRVQGEAGPLDVPARARGEHQVGVQCGTPASQEPALNLGILRETSLADTFLGQRILLQSRGERVLARPGVLLVEQLGAGQAGTGNGMVECLRLGLRARRRSQSGLRLGRAGCGREEMDLVADSAAKILKGFLDVGWVVVRLVGVLRAGTQPTS